ncbi:MAG TPA: GNAT family N-acetyltransferase [Beutenbergiaceae bacterium]|nr:GNAT family N-acetyltransferase [Beutenbergiaceae bacterium]
MTTPEEITQPLSVRAQAPAEQPPLPSVEGLQWRGLGAADLDAFHALALHLETEDDLLFRSTPEESQDRLMSTGVANGNVVGAFDDAGALQAFAGVRRAPEDEGSVRVFLDGGVSPAYRRKGIGTILLDWQIARARQLLAESDRHVPGRIVANAEENLPDAVHMLVSRGFRPQRWYFDLRRDLSQPIPDLELERSLQIVPWSEDLNEQCRLAHNDAFEMHWGSEPSSPETWAEDREFLTPEWSFLVLDNSSDRSKVVGYLLSGRYEQDWDSLGWTEGYIDMLGVRQAWRNRGIATALVAHAMKIYAGEGIEYAAVGVDAAAPSKTYGLFSTLDFEAIRSSTMFAIEI